MDPRIHQLHQSMPVHTYKKVHKNSQSSFKDALQEASGLNVSKHAQQRLDDRNIKIDDSQWQRISERMSEAKSKGVTDSLVVLKDAALVVSTKNNTVVTAMNKDDTESHIFTNINGTIILND
ncbi:TIGR02530 family flagellar biosynthesis protein [Halobacillus campisalis]|uniref:TIGR02530 family flagellar biosynthesis protein n=1 Tax=Halobacillus campisalis TaxID=435909 RepID=A0ABW2K2X6_9BACI|nr:TIGR02530 family flagellar biosynthesis protein [Halobacillus campisalis]